MRNLRLKRFLSTIGNVDKHIHTDDTIRYDMLYLKNTARDNISCFDSFDLHQNFDDDERTNELKNDLRA